MSINWPAPCWLHHMERSGCNSWDRPGHSARELEGQAAGDILICAAMCKGMHLQSGSVPVIRLASIFSENGRKTRKKGERRSKGRGPRRGPRSIGFSYMQISDFRSFEKEKKPNMETVDNPPRVLSIKSR